MFIPWKWYLLIKQICVICEHWWFADQRKNHTGDRNSFLPRDKLAPPFPKILIQIRYERHKPEISQFIQGQGLCVTLAFYLSLQDRCGSMASTPNSLRVFVCFMERQKKGKINGRAEIWTRAVIFVMKSPYKRSIVDWWLLLSPSFLLSHYILVKETKIKPHHWNKVIYKNYVFFYKDLFQVDGLRSFYIEYQLESWDLEQYLSCKRGLKWIKKWGNEFF